MKDESRIEKKGREKISGFLSSLISVLLSFLVAIIFGGILFKIKGISPVEAYILMLKGAFGSKYALTETLAKTSPILLCGLAVALPASLKIWNIGAEGQLFLGAFAASWIAMNSQNSSHLSTLFSMGLLGFAGGAFWAFIPGILRAKLKVNEIITTLLLNYVGILWVTYLIHGPWRGEDNFPYTQFFPDNAHLPTIGNSRLHYGLFIGIFISVLIWLFLRYTRFGFEIKVIGDNWRAADYAGIPTKWYYVIMMTIGGGIAGLAGMTEVAGIHHRLQAQVSTGYGYTAIIVAWLARNHPIVLPIISFLFGALLVGGENIQIDFNLPVSFIGIFQGIILIAVLIGDFIFLHKKI